MSQIPDAESSENSAELVDELPLLVEESLHFNLLFFSQLKLVERIGLTHELLEHESLQDFKEMHDMLYTQS